MAGLATAFGSGAMTNSIAEIAGAETILVIGSNTTEAHPIVGLQVKKAVKKHGAKLIVADPRPIALTRLADIWLPLKPGTNVALLNGMMKVIIEEGLEDQRFIAERTEGYEEFKKVIDALDLEETAQITGVSVSLIREAARMYAQAEKASILYAMGITQHSSGTGHVLSTANIAMLTGNVGKESAGVNPRRGQSNVQGACDMGCLPNVFPGYQKVSDAGVLSKFENKWNVPLSNKPGLTVTEMFHGALTGEVKGLYVMGENPMLSDPDLNKVKKALESLEFLVVQDIFLTETAKMADVVLPAVSFAEKEGTVTNTERRVQKMNKALESTGEGKEDWKIIKDLAGVMGYAMHYPAAENIFRELTELTPIYNGITYKRIDPQGIQWPCPSAHHSGTKYLHHRRFSKGLGKFSPVEYTPPAEIADDEYPFILTTGRILFHFHTGSMSRRVFSLNEISPEGFLEMSAKDADYLGIESNEEVVVKSRRGKLKVKALVKKNFLAGTVFLPFHFQESPANILTNTALDPVAKIPELKVCAVKIEKIKK